MSETQLVSSILARLRLEFPATVMVARINAGTIMVGDGAARRPFRAAPKGWSDIIGVGHNGRFIALEAKVGKNKPTPAQREFMQNVRDLGGYATVVRCVEHAVAAIHDACDPESTGE